MKKDTYVLNRDGKIGMEYRKALEDAAGTLKLPSPPTVDLELEIRNTGKEETTILVGPDQAFLTLDLQGPGAVRVDTGLPFAEIKLVPRK